MVDRSGSKTIQSPYGSQPTTVIQAIFGTYAPAAWTTTDSTLTVTDEFICAEHVFDFEETLTNFDLFANRLNEQQYSVAQAIDAYVLNNLLEEGNAAYSTPAGGFTTASNVNTIMGSLISKVAGYAESYSNGMYLVIENTDLPGILVASATNGFSFADAALNNGRVTSYMGVDIYVVRASTFIDSTGATGTVVYTNLNHRLFGVKNSSTYAAPQGIKFEEKGVSGKTGKEVVTYGYVGHKLWKSKEDLVVDITLV